MHLARVIGLLGHHEEAARTLRRGIGSASDPLLAYYADMFLGDEEQALGHRQAARQCYENAAARYPAAQAPHLALGQLARRFGDRRAALAAIERALAATTQPRVCDASLEYPLVSYRDTDAVAAAHTLAEGAGFRAADRPPCGCRRLRVLGRPPGPARRPPRSVHETIR